ncbi:MAG: hypothetical protein RSB44_12995, partial [Carnobacterium sp.]
LQTQCFDWSGNSNNIDDWYDDDIYNAVTSSENPYLKFIDNIDKIKKLADNHHFHFIDVNDGLSDENGNLKKELTFDGAHLNPAGYQLVLENLKVYLEE